jgi:ATP-dependent RNA helicase RhlE
MPFTKFGLSDPLVRGILATGYTAPTEIQSQAIPTAIRGKDIVGCAQTGTGKTAAFVLPLLNRLGHEKTGGKHRIRSLIVTPTRELAAQIEQCILDYGRYLKLRTLAIYGGVSINPQLATLQRGVDIVVATPGRLLDHMQRGSINLKSVEVFVLDEADRMFDMGFINDVKKITAALPKHRQTMLFSATMPPEVKKLAAGILKSPKTIQVGQQRNPIETVTQTVYAVEKPLKLDLLLYMLKETPMFSVLVFSRTKHGADKIRRKLERAGVPAIALHSGRTQSQRDRALEGFKKAKYQVLVATDIAARGIDVEGITHVINFDVPSFAEDYIHRIGRTGRATATGDAITFVASEEQRSLRNIEKFIGCRFKSELCPGFSYIKSEPPAQPARYTSKKPKKTRRASPQTKAKRNTGASGAKPRLGPGQRRKKTKRS